MKLIGIAIAAVMLVACASSPVPTSKTTEIPTARIYDNKFFQPGSDRGHILIKRDGAYFGVDCDNFVSVDGVKVAQIEPAERLDLFLSPEEHVIGVSRSRSCGNEVKELSVTPIVDSTKTYRISVGPNGLLEFQRTAY